MKKIYLKNFDLWNSYIMDIYLFIPTIGQPQHLLKQLLVLPGLNILWIDFEPAWKGWKI